MVDFLALRAVLLQVDFFFGGGGESVAIVFAPLFESQVLEFDFRRRAEKENGSVLFLFLLSLEFWIQKYTLIRVPL